MDTQERDIALLKSMYFDGRLTVEEFEDWVWGVLCGVLHPTDLLGPPPVYNDKIRYAPTADRWA